MKRLELLLVLFLGATLTVRAQDSASSKSVFLDVVESNGNSKTVNHWRDISGNYSQTKTSSKELDVTVRNMSPNLPGDFEVEWYFFGKPASGSGRFLYDKGTKKITMAPSGSEKVPIESKELAANTVRDNYWYGYSYTSGDKADGWIIRVKSGGEVIRVKGSSPLLEQTAADETAFEKLTKTGPEKAGKIGAYPIARASHHNRRSPSGIVDIDGQDQNRQQPRSSGRKPSPARLRQSRRLLPRLNDSVAPFDSRGPSG